MARKSSLIRVEDYKYGHLDDQSKGNRAKLTLQIRLKLWSSSKEDRSRVCSTAGLGMMMESS
jgi:hypothetical protein